MTPFPVLKSTDGLWYNVAIEIHKILSLDTPNQIFIKGKILDDHVCNFEHFCQNNKYNEIGWPILIVLYNVGKEKDELRDLNSQFKHCINDLKVSMTVLKETLTSYSHKAETDKNQTQNVIQ